MSIAILRDDCVRRRVRVEEIHIHTVFAPISSPTRSSLGILAFWNSNSEELRTWFARYRFSYPHMKEAAVVFGCSKSSFAHI